MSVVVRLNQHISLNEKGAQNGFSILPLHNHFFSSGFFAASSFFSCFSSLRPLTAFTAATLPMSPIQYYLLAQPSGTDVFSSRWRLIYTPVPSILIYSVVCSAYRACSLCAVIFRSVNPAALSGWAGEMGNSIPTPSQHLSIKSARKCTPALKHEGQEKEYYDKEGYKKAGHDHGSGGLPDDQVPGEQVHR